MSEIKLYNGNCVDVLKTLPENSIDTCLTDPPYEIRLFNKGWDDTGDAFDVKTWREVYRVMKPGAILLSFGSPRTYHRLTCAIEDAGFLIKDCIMWIHGQGFPKAQDIGKLIDKSLGMERPVIGRAKNAEEIMRRNSYSPNNNEGWDRPCRQNEEWIYSKGNITAPASEEAKIWDGWGTVSLKPAYEPIVVAMKPLDVNYVTNALTHGVAGLSIKTSKIYSEGEEIVINNWNDSGNFFRPSAGEEFSTKIEEGRFPTNVIHDGSDEVTALFPDSVNRKSKNWRTNEKSVARFFYCAKPSQKERNHGLKENNNNHPTIKPLKLIEYLTELTNTPTKGIVLDPFMGSGTTGVACISKGRSFIGIEKEKKYYDIAEERIGYAKKDLPLDKYVNL